MVIAPPTSYGLGPIPSKAMLFGLGFSTGRRVARTQVDLQDISQQMLTNRRIRLETGTAFWLSVANSALRDACDAKKRWEFWGER
jgi:hypothetical protein